VYFPVQILVVVAIILFEIHRRLKRIRFPCEQYLDMGQSVLTPKEVLLGKAKEPELGGLIHVFSFSFGVLIWQRGKGNSGSRFRNQLVGNIGRGECKSSFLLIKRL